jgi:hypothetical protein
MPTEKEGITWRDLMVRRMWELTRGGGWHDIEDLYPDLGRFIPPGYAIRRNERDMKLNRRKRGSDVDAPRHRGHDPFDRARSGRRTLVRETLASSSVIERDGDKVRLTGKPSVIRGDERRARVLRPPLDALASELLAMGVPRAADQVRLTAHEFGIHLTMCPEGCELLPLPKPEPETETDDESLTPGRTPHHE